MQAFGAHLPLREHIMTRPGPAYMKHRKRIPEVCVKVS
jgi:hypothetical protein